MNIFYKILVLFTSFLTITQISSADNQRWIAVEVNKVSEVIVTPKDKVINFAFFSNTRDVSTLDFALTTPAGSVVSAKSLGVTRSTSLDNALKNQRAMYIQEIARYGGKFTKSIRVTNTSSNNKTGNQNLICNGMYPDSILGQLSQQFIRIKGVPATSTDEICDLFAPGWRQFGNSGGNTIINSDLVQLKAVSHVLKDMCAKDNFKYLVVLSVDLSKVKSSVRASNFTMSIDLIEKLYQGGTAGTVKPFTPEGRFKGKTLVLFEQISPLDQHQYTRWSRGNVKRLLSTKTLKRGKTTPHQRWVFTVTLPGRLMSGGQMTVIPFDLNTSYGVCIRATNTRQCYGGYTGGEC
jgi:hypothetical protein